MTNKPPNLNATIVWSIFFCCKTFVPNWLQIINLEQISWQTYLNKTYIQKIIINSFYHIIICFSCTRNFPFNLFYLDFPIIEENVLMSFFDIWKLCCLSLWIVLSCDQICNLLMYFFKINFSISELTH